MIDRNWPLALWLKIQEPRIVSVIQFFVYLLALAAGWAALAKPPRSVEVTAGQGLTFYWSIMLICGGVLGAITVLPGWWLFERAATIACLGSTVIYGVTIWSSHVAGSGSGNRIPQLCMVLIVAAHFAKRWFSIRRYAYDPER